MCKPRTKDATDIAVYSPYDTVSTQEDQFTEAMRDYYRTVEWEYRDGQVEMDRKKERERLYAILLIFLVSMHDGGYQDGVERLRGAVPAIPAVPFPVPAESPAFIFAKEEAARAAKSIVETIHEEMKAAASKAEEAGLPPDEVKAAAGAKLDELTKIGPERVSSTETVKAFNAGTIQAWDDSGVVDAVKWHTQEDERVCPFCEAMNTIIRPIGAPFWLKGETMYVDRERPGYFSASPFGEPGPYKLQMVFDYGDIDGPPLHVLCRCYLEFVLGNDNGN